MRAQQFTLKNRPKGILSAEDLDLVITDLPTVEPGSIKVRTLLWGVDPGLRMRLSGETSYAAALPIGGVISGFTVGEIVEENDTSFSVGDIVTGAWGWCDFSVVQAGQVRPAPERGALPLSSLLGTMGVPGVTSYFGLLEVGDLKAGENVLVTSAAGGVGSITSQIGKIKGARVIGLAGGADKCNWLTQSLGLDGAIDYKSDVDLDTQLTAQFPDGIDVVFENIGNRMVDLVLPHMREKGRIVICGQTEDYNTAPEERYGIKNTSLMIGKRLRMEGFVALDYADRYEQARAPIRQWSKEGRLLTKENITIGFKNLPDAFASLFVGSELGRRLVAADESCTR